MVYYHTSANVKMLRMIMIDFSNATEISPYEYMKTYIEKCPEDTEDAKLSWIAETFLSFEKHHQFLKDMASHLHEELSNEDQDYFMIVLHAIIFQILPKDMQYLYKCLYNLSKPLLDTFTKFLSKNEVLTFISQVAQVYYDTKYITEQIIRPIFEWQPYISEMEHNYAAFVKKTEDRKIKPPTVPVQPNVLNRKGKQITASKSNPATASSQEVSIADSPPYSLNIAQKKKKRMLTKNTLDQRLNQIHEKNKKKAANLLNEVKKKDFHYAQVTKSDKYWMKLSNMKYDIENNLSKSYRKPRQDYVPKQVPEVKANRATIKRLNKRIQMEEKEEVQWLQNIICYRNTSKIEEIAEEDRQEKERERVLDIEKKHLMGLITYEEAVLSKKKLVDENKKKYEDFLKEKQTWNEEIEKWKKHEIEKNKKQVDKLCFLELNVLTAKNEASAKKKEMAETLKKQSEMLLANAMLVKQEELERRINMIKEIKALEIIAKKAKVPKIIDLTDTSRLGLLCEMSIAELQERLNAMKISVKDELESKRKAIIEEKQQTKKEMEDTKNNIKKYLEEQTQIRKQNKKVNPVTLSKTASKNIDDLKKILEEKRTLRMKLNNPPLPTI